MFSSVQQRKFQRFSKFGKYLFAESLNYASFAIFIYTIQSGHFLKRYTASTIQNVGTRLGSKKNKKSD